MMRKANIICVICPLGCEISVEGTDNSIVKIVGNECPRGEKYATAEFLHPTRILTTTVKIEGYIYPVLPVRTNKPIPKEHIFSCMDKLKKVKVEAPVRIGQVLVENILGCGADVIATQNTIQEEFFNLP